jgi:Domain of unknown function (DUF1929)
MPRLLQKPLLLGPGIAQEVFVIACHIGSRICQSDRLWRNRRSLSTTQIGTPRAELYAVPTRCATNLAAGPDGGPAEIFDQEDPTGGWERCAPMKYKRGYHSAAILLTDGSVLVGGDPPGTWGDGGFTPNERYFPSCFAGRPAITGSPALLHYGATFTINTPNAPAITEVVLIRPGAVTHGFNMSQRFIGCEITGAGLRA